MEFKHGTKMFGLGKGKIGLALTKVGKMEEDQV